MSGQRLFIGLAIAVGVCLLLAEVALLKGTQIAHKNISLSNQDALVFTVAQPGKSLLIEIETKRGYGKKKKGRALRYRILDPNDIVLEEESEVIGRKKRYVRFTPSVAGEYVIEVEPQSGSSGSARTRVYVGDKRITPRLGW